MPRLTSALFTDLYELTMMQGYFLLGFEQRVVFDTFFRRQPYGGGFGVFAGLEDLLESLRELRFSAQDITYLDSLRLFRPEFLRYLSEFRFRGDVFAMAEGDIVFPLEPLVRVHAPLVEAQLIESLVLNTLNFQTLIATKAARVYVAACGGSVLEFGMRRAQGMDGALSASRAAYVGGAAATSNTLAGRLYGIPVRGTMAHSWVMAFDTEAEAFQRFAEVYPENCILLIDTYDTLSSGLENAIRVGRSLQGGSGAGFGVRLDSGDLEYLARAVRARLDQAGLRHAVIAASNELSEDIIHQLVQDGAPIDIWGVGTSLVTGGTDASLSGVYKLTAREVDGAMAPTIKISNNPDKTTNPGVKQVYRFLGANGAPIADLMALEEEHIEGNGAQVFHHPSVDTSHRLADYAEVRPMLKQRMAAGEIVGERPALAAIREHALDGLRHLDDSYKRIINPHIFKVSLSGALKNLKRRMIEEIATGRPARVRGSGL
jgi:nicotinate phosphoribosyltransferase